MIKNSIFISMVLLIIGCSMKPGETAILNVFTSADRFNNGWMLKHDDYESMTPLAKDSDWGKVWSQRFNPQGGWFGGQSDSGHGLHLLSTNHDISYDIDFNVSISPYSQIDRALERGDVEFISKKYKQGTEDNGRIYWINTHIEEHGKEKYKCLVYEDYKPANKSLKVDIKTKTIACSKFNPQRTMTKEVAITLIYTLAPDMPKELEYLTKDYTYEDLQQRAERILDSLYIKDGWDK